MGEFRTLSAEKGAFIDGAVLSNASCSHPSASEVMHKEMDLHSRNVSRKERKSQIASLRRNAGITGFEELFRPYAQRYAEHIYPKLESGEITEDEYRMSQRSFGIAVSNFFCKAAVPKDETALRAIFEDITGIAIERGAEYALSSTFCASSAEDWRHIVREYPTIDSLKTRSENAKKQWKAAIGAAADAVRDAVAERGSGRTYGELLEGQIEQHERTEEVTISPYILNSLKKGREQHDEDNR
jgi:hypothetical protein